MTDDLPFDYGTEARPATAAPRRCRRHVWSAGHVCERCGRPYNPILGRRGTNNRKRGNAEELTVAREVGGHKMGPLGLPWDVEMPGYARLQVKKLATPPSLRYIADQLARIPGPEMAGLVWIEPGRGGERLIVLRLKDFAERHGVRVEE